MMLLLNMKQKWTVFAFLHLSRNKCAHYPLNLLKVLQTLSWILFAWFKKKRNANKDGVLQSGLSDFENPSYQIWRSFNFNKFSLMGCSVQGWCLFLHYLTHLFSLSSIWETVFFLHMNVNLNPTPQIGHIWDPEQYSLPFTSTGSSTSL